MYVYLETERSAEHVLYTVGFYSPDGTWHSESDHNEKEEAAKRTAFLNGSFVPKISKSEASGALRAVMAETVPIEGHDDPGAISDCYATLSEFIACS